MHHITLLLLPDILASSITLPLEMFNAAENMRRSQEPRSKRLEIAIASVDSNPVTTSGGLTIVPNILLKNVHQTDLVIIPALWRNPLQALKRFPDVIDWLKKIATNKPTICAVGTGSSFMAEANLIHHKAATTHWFYFNLMEKKYPDVDWKRQQLITRSDNIYCAGSVNSIADLSIHFIEKGINPSIARRVESQFSPEIRRAYDTHLFDETTNSRHKDETIAQAQDLIRSSYANDISFKVLSQELGLAHRSFQRRFKQATGFTPLKYLQYIRVQNARELLQNTDLNIQDIAEHIGYVDASHFSRVFKLHTENTPNAYRKAVRGKLFSP